MTSNTNKDGLLESIEKTLLTGRPANKCLHPKKIIDNSPRGYRYIRCNSRSWGYCSYCANRYQIDKKMIVGSGCLQKVIGDDVSVKEYDFFALTLSAPSFGKVHKVSRNRGDKCDCGKFHSMGHSLVGTPVDVYRYRYRDQVEWNVAANELLRYTMKYLQDNLGIGTNFQYVAAREWQQRGSIHVHILVRVPKGAVEERKVVRALKRAKLYKMKSFGWGRMSYVDTIPHDRLPRIVNYLTKSLGKTARQQSRRYGILSDALIDHYARLDRQAVAIPCNKGVHCLKKDCTHKQHNQFGWSGHIITTSSKWGFRKVTLKTIGEDRAAWVEENKESFDDSFEKELEEMYIKNERMLDELLPPIEGGFDKSRAENLLDSFGLLNSKDN